MDKILDGRPVAKEIYQELKEEVAQLYDKGIIPRLSVFKVGNDPASEYYVQNIQKKAKKIGVVVDILNFVVNTSQDMIIAEIQKANKDPKVHGIMLQMPLPKHLNQNDVVMQIDPRKDIDGLHPINMGKLVLGQDCFVASTPAAVMELIHYYNIPTKGNRVVIIGRSNIVGLPLFHLLVQKNAGADATVTVCHSRSTNLQKIALEADILIVAIGKPKFVDHAYVSSNSNVIDVGINEVYDADAETNLFVGDVNYIDVFPIVKAITPVPGGVGTITTASLLKNVVRASKL
ncbi:MAG: bifunctional 5,10-methylenetetrahydrofolate dehydrogenase/5,10-methenyltetrahydrofolate cyclohydrolase [Candidatus Cloacimonetes bacterium]|nr:bifunctional 5,10-methylenetetrahydrofolate dehydrogenase/5,10-methenyltetrahydrofolate cyclohydrolase [Candidatus Cloacimonadota bacterium]